MIKPTFPKTVYERVDYERELCREVKNRLITVYQTGFDARCDIERRDGWDDMADINESIESLEKIEDEVQSIYKKLALMSLIHAGWHPIEEKPTEHNRYLVKVQCTLAGKLHEGIIESLYLPARGKWILPLGWETNRKDVKYVEWCAIPKAWQKCHEDGSNRQATGLFFRDVESVPQD